MPSSYTLGDHFETFIREQIEEGRYASASEVVYDGLRREIEVGRRSGSPKPARGILDRLERKYAKIAKERGG